MILFCSILCSSFCSIQIASFVIIILFLFDFVSCLAVKTIETRLWTGNLARNYQRVSTPSHISYVEKLSLGAFSNFTTCNVTQTRMAVFVNGWYFRETEV